MGSHSPELLGEAAVWTCWVSPIPRCLYHACKINEKKLNGHGHT